MENLHRTFDAVVAAADINIAVDKQEVVGIIGANGAGKTTLMRTVMGLVRPQNGRIRFGDGDLVALAAYKRAHLGVGYMPEDRRLVPQLSVEENVLLPVWATGDAGFKERLARIYELMPEVARFATRKALQLSGGQQKLAALARALMCGTKLLLDEPFEGVAPALARRLAEVLSDLKGEGLSVLLSESDYTYSADLLDHLFVIERGAVQEKHAGNVQPDTALEERKT